MTCVFCDRPVREHLIAENEFAIAFPDAFPLTRGHALIIPRRHAGDVVADFGDRDQADRAIVITPIGGS